MADAWKPAQYERFREERAQPFWDLAALVDPRPGMTIVDLGCGTGELTAQLHQKLQARETIGIDSSAAMLARAPSVPGLRFEQRDVAGFAPQDRFDLVFSNAALHWIPDHAGLFKRLTTAQLIEICGKAGDQFLKGTLPLGDKAHTQSADDYVRTLSATSVTGNIMRCPDVMR